MASIKYLLAFMIMATMACSAFAIHCYQCESLSNPKCGEKFEADDSFKFDCARISPPRFLQNFLPVRNATGCMKKTLEAVSGHPQILRTCFFGDTTNTQSGCAPDPSLPFIKTLTCDVCSGDLCNGSLKVTPIALTLLAFFALALILS